MRLIRRVSICRPLTGGDDSTDPVEIIPDNRILECATAGGAALIVTGDRAMLALGQFEGVEIITLREFLRRQEAGD